MTIIKNRIKILVAGPPHAGKSVVSNVLAGQDRPDMVRQYVPTNGVRILEFARDLSGFGAKAPQRVLGSKDNNLTVELWDLSGDERATMFPNLRESQLLVFSHKLENPAQSRNRPKLGKPLSRVPVFFTSIEQDIDLMRREFDSFLVNCVRAATDQQGSDESAVLQAVATGPGAMPA
ncbi:hypothetical protein H9P43_001602 [Blastocladiella emersonii ATCC 22665]|nr:hypothetical protein H9P43_001602 [Blastocladiella emersonii ATCC 22665]